MHYNDWQVAESEDEWLEKQIESEKSISALEQQIRQLKVTSHIADDSLFAGSFNSRIKN